MMKKRTEKGENSNKFFSLLVFGTLNCFFSYILLTFEKIKVSVQVTIE